MNVITRVKRRTAISTVPRIPIWRPSAEGYALAEALSTIRTAATEVLERPMYYQLLPDHSVRPITGPNAVLEWAREFEKATRPLIATDVDGWRVSTIFLGFDHSFMRDAPELFETMVFTSTTATREIFGRTREHHEAVEQQRYATYEQAMLGHAECVGRTQHIVWGINKLKGQADEG
jgi:hypothetical protein